MHPLNKWRLQAGLTIKPELEQITEAKNSDKEQPRDEKALTARVSGVRKAIMHLENAVKALNSIPRGKYLPRDHEDVREQIEKIIGSDNEGLKEILKTYENDAGKKPVKESEERVAESHVDKDEDKMVKDKSGKKWKIVGHEKGEGEDEVYHLECPKSGKKVDKKASELLDEMMRRDTGMMGSEAEEEPERFQTADDFKQGEKVLYDNGIWIVHVADAKADLVGLVPASMKDASKEEKDRAMQQVKRDKLRKPSEEECEAMAGFMESTLNYTPSNALSHEDEEDEPVNVVGQDDKSWANSLNPKNVKDEYTNQLDNRGDQSMDDYANKVKVPNKVKTALKDAIAAFEKDAAKLGDTQTAKETRVFYQDTAMAFQKMLDYLNDGTIQGVKQAQVYASTLMGPMLHKLPDVVWDFVVSGGKKRSLKDYMNPVDKKYPITGPQNTQD